VSAALLPEELVAWERQDLEPLWGELLVELDHFFIVGFCGGSLAGDVDDQEGFLVFEGGEVDGVAGYGGDLEGEEFIDLWLDSVGSSLEKYAAHVGGEWLLLGI